MAESKQNVKKKRLTHADVMTVLEHCYDKSLAGIENVSPPVQEIADAYLAKYGDSQKACKVMMRKQIAKCATSGFVTGLGGLITMPVTLPANVGSVLYFQMRMVACAAALAGFELESERMRAFVCACMAGISLHEIKKHAGKKIGEKITEKGIEEIPEKVLVKINEKIGFKFLEKFGSKGVANLGRIVPGVGGLINGGFDFFETKEIAHRAYSAFFTDDSSFNT